MSIYSALLSPIIAHRGASGEAPENTLAALELAVEQGARCVEFDVSISFDNVAYVHHDDTLDRCTSGSGQLSDHTALELDKLTAGRYKNNTEDEELLRLSTAIEFLVKHDIGLNLEIKPREGLEQRTCNAIFQLMTGAWPSHLPLVYSSFSYQSLGYMMELSPEVTRGLLVDNVPLDVLTLAEKYACKNIHCNSEKLKQSDAQKIKANNLGLYCFTVNETKQAQRLFDMGVDGVITDYPLRLISSGVRPQV